MFSLKKNVSQLYLNLKKKKQTKSKENKVLSQ